MTTPADTDVLILAGGAGTHSRSYLGGVPKFLVPISGKLLAAHLLKYLSDQGFRRAVLALSGAAGCADQILWWLGTVRFVQSGTPFDIVTSIEPEPRGVTSAIIAARPHLLSNPIMIINGDTLLDLDLTTVLSRFSTSGLSIMTIVSNSGVHTGCTIMTRGVLAGIGATSYDDILTAGSDAHISWFTTSRCFVDIGTAEGYQAANRGNGINEMFTPRLHPHPLCWVPPRTR